MRAMDATWRFKEVRRPCASKATCSFIRGVFQRCILGGTTLDTLSSGISQELPFSGRCFRSIQRIRCVVSSKYPCTYLFSNLPCRPPTPSNSKSAFPYVAHCTSPSTRRGLPEVESSTSSKIIAMQRQVRSCVPRRCAWFRHTPDSSRRPILDQNVVLIGKLFPVKIWVRNRTSFPIPTDLNGFEPAISIHPKTAHLLCGKRSCIPLSPDKIPSDAAPLADARGGPPSFLLNLSRASFHDRSIGPSFRSVFRRSCASMARNQLQMDVAMDDHLFVVFVASARHVVFASTRLGRCLRRDEVRETWNEKCWWTSSACSIRRRSVAWRGKNQRLTADDGSTTWMCVEWEQSGRGGR